MIDVVDKKNCCGCGACFNACPKHCIKLVRDKEGFIYPLINNDNCIKCNLCESVCPFMQVSSVRRTDNKIVLAAENKNPDILLNSSSGGIFYSIAKDIIISGGVVCSASYSNDFTKVEHLIVSSIIDLQRLTKSKYLQSECHSCFSKIRELLTSNIQVLFCGTPCQVCGLKNYLKKDYNNLLLIEVICHGVPPQKLWEKYLLFINKKKAKIKDVNMRDKRNGWDNFGISVLFDDSSEYYSAFTKDIYCRLFNNNYSLRPSCYDCQVKKRETMADITIGDFWGKENFSFDFGSNGVSVVVLNTKKGLERFQRIKSDFNICKIDNYSDVFPKYNKSIETCQTMPINRESFFSDLQKNKSFNYLEYKYLYSGVKGKIKYILHKMGMKKY